MTTLQTSVQNSLESNSHHAEKNVWFLELSQMIIFQTINLAIIFSISRLI